MAPVDLSQADQKKRSFSLVRFHSKNIKQIIKSISALVFFGVLIPRSDGRTIARINEREYTKTDFAKIALRDLRWKR